VYARFVPEVARILSKCDSASSATTAAMAVALACTEIPLLISPADSPLPILDSTRILARAALREATAAENENRNEARG